MVVVGMQKRTISKDEAIENYLSRIDMIKDDDIRQFVENALDDAPNEYWTAIGSVSRRNHPPEDNIECGLIIHVTKAMEVAEELFRFFGVNDTIDQDIVRSAVMLHDLYKQGLEWSDSTDREHGLICAEVLEKYELDAYIKRKIQKCIGAHMSRWSYPFSSLMAGYNPDKLVLIVQLSDYIASRNNISFYPSKYVVDV